MTWLLTIKAKLYAIGAALIAFVGIILRNRYLSQKADRAAHRADVAEAAIRQRKRIDQGDADIDAEFEHWAKQMREDREKVPGNLSNPNDF